MAEEPPSTRDPRSSILQRVIVTHLSVRLITLLLLTGLISAGLQWLARFYGYQSNDANLPLTSALAALLVLIIWLIWHRTRPATTYTLDELVKDHESLPGRTDLPKDES